MALENCFGVGTVCTSRAGVLQARHPFSSIEKLNLPICKGLNSSGVSWYSSSSSFDHPSISRTRRIVCKAREAVEVEVVTDCSWNEFVVASESPVLVEFWAPWCGPCRMIAPVIDELAKEYAGKILCFKLNTDEYPNIPKQYGIRSIPTVLFFKDGEKKESVIGAVPKSTFITSIEKFLDI